MLDEPESPGEILKRYALARMKPPDHEPKTNARGAFDEPPGWPWMFLRKKGLLPSPAPMA